jgi:hypothetical protein
VASPVQAPVGPEPLNNLFSGSCIYRGTPDISEFEDAVILKVFGDLPDDFRFVT